MREMLQLVRWPLPAPVGAPGLGHHQTLVPHLRKDGVDFPPRRRREPEHLADQFGDGCRRTPTIAQLQHQHGRVIQVVNPGFPGVIDDDAVLALLGLQAVDPPWRRRHDATRAASALPRRGAPARGLHPAIMLLTASPYHPRSLPICSRPTIPGYQARLRPHFTIIRPSTSSTYGHRSRASRTFRAARDPNTT